MLLGKIFERFVKDSRVGHFLGYDRGANITATPAIGCWGATFCLALSPTRPQKATTGTNPKGKSDSCVNCQVTCSS